MKVVFSKGETVDRCLLRRLTSFVIEELPSSVCFLISPRDLFTEASSANEQTKGKVNSGRDFGPDTHSPAGSFPNVFFFFFNLESTILKYLV